MAAPLFRISLFNGARSPRLPHSVPLSGTRAGTLPVEGSCVKYKHLCKFYTGLEPACIKNIHLCSGLTFKILFNYSILAILFKFGTRIAMFRGNSVRNTGQQIKKIRRQAVNIYGKTEQISAPPQPPSGRRGPTPQKPPPLIEPSNHRNIPLLCGRPSFSERPALEIPRCGGRRPVDGTRPGRAQLDSVGFAKDN